MDLDKSIDIILNRALEFNTLDTFCDNLVNHIDICSDAEAVRQNITKKGYCGCTVPRDKKFNDIVDVSLLLQIEDDYEFLELLYIESLNRPIESTTLKQRLKELESKSIKREDILKSLEASDEGKEKNVLLAGFSEFNVLDYKDCIDKDFVDILYIRLLKRRADAHGLKDFTVKLKSKALTRHEVVLKIVNSPEAQKINMPKIIFSDTSDDTCSDKLKNKKSKCKTKLNIFPKKEKQVSKELLEIIEKDYDEYVALESMCGELKKDIIELQKQIDTLFNR